LLLGVTAGCMPGDEAVHTPAAGPLVTVIFNERHVDGQGF
jgi:hypothetical protein